MGDPKFARRHYLTPSHPWDGARIAEENQIIHKYGLKNKRELWKHQTMLRELRHQARELQARLRSSDEQAVKERDALLEHLQRLGLLSGKADLNDVLSLEVEALLARRLQTQTYLKGLARSVKQARQLIVHGHISIGGRKVTVPGYMVPDEDTSLIDYTMRSPFTSDMHPERPAADFVPHMTTVKEERRAAAEKDRDMRRTREIERIAAMRKAIADDQEDEEMVSDETSDEDIADVAPDDEEAAEGEEQDDKGPKGSKDADAKAPAEKEPKGPKDAKDAKAPAEKEPKDKDQAKGGEA